MTPLLDAVRVTKRFPGVVALDAVDFTVQPGEVHALLGENGAGKSTLTRIIAGDYAPDGGELRFAGTQAKLGSPRDARALGVRIVTQERSLAPTLSVTENILMGRLPVRRRRRTVHWAAAHEQAAAALARLGLEVDPRRELGRLRPAAQQLVEIARALSDDGRLVILDEPTAALSAQETENLFGALRGLRESGVGIVYISHRVGELADIADRVTILRDGRRIATQGVADATPAELVQAMVGRELEDLYPREHAQPGDVVLRMEDVSADDVCHAVSLEVRAGEIVAVFGLMGSGATELPYVAAGDVRASGAIGRPVPHSLVPVDRGSDGLLPQATVARNIGLASLPAYRRGGVFRRSLERAAADRRAESLAIRPANVDATITHLSGGNQQKAIIGRGLEAGARLFLLSEPTRGVDIGARADIYRILVERCGEGAGVLFASSDLEEVVGLADRVYVMSRRRVTARLSGDQITSERLLEAATR